MFVLNFKKIGKKCIINVLKNHRKRVLETRIARLLVMYEYVCVELTKCVLHTLSALYLLGRRGRGGAASIPGEQSVPFPRLYNTRRCVL